MLAIAGPTACGKSRFAMMLAAACSTSNSTNADNRGSEIISVDSGAVYCDMDIGTAKPSAEEQGHVAHHIINVCKPNAHFNVGRFCELAHAAVADITQRKRQAIFVGGSMMYYRTLMSGLYDCPPIPSAVRNKVRQQVQQHGIEAMHAQLAKWDATTAATISSKDVHRVCRALELILVSREDLTDTFLSEDLTNIKSCENNLNDVNNTPLIWQQQQAIKSLQFIVLMPSDRTQLRSAIAQRLKNMFAQGLVEETRDLIQQYGLNGESQSLRLAGYRQVAAFLRGEYDEKEMQRRAYHATCQLAKRQMTWLRTWPQPVAIIDPFAKNADGLLMQSAKKAGMVF